MSSHGFNNNSFAKDELDHIENYETNSHTINSCASNQLSVCTLRLSDKSGLKNEDLPPRKLNAKEYILILVLGFTIFSCFSGYSVVSPILPR